MGTRPRPQKRLSRKDSLRSDTDLPVRMFGTLADTRDLVGIVFLAWGIQHSFDTSFSRRVQMIQTRQLALTPRSQNGSVRSAFRRFGFCRLDRLVLAAAHFFHD